MGGDALDRVRAGLIAVEGFRGEIAGEVSAGGESPDADLVGVEAEVGGVAADVADGARAVEHGDGISVSGTEAVLEDKCCDAVRGQPSGFDRPFFFNDEVGVAAAGQDDDGGADPGPFGWVVEELRDVGWSCALGKWGGARPQRSCLGKATWLVFWWWRGFGIAGLCVHGCRDQREQHG